PLKLFAPLALFHFLVGLGYYGYTFFTQNRLTNMTVLLMTGAVTVFLIGLVSEQITQLLYQPTESNKADQFGER
ncbi:MAG: glycosyltransferase family 2 protein, partial [Pseudomonadota bacterium]|nr:glycosyltransferase family 2 protein [Pseudomonadota bacterium]